MYTYKCTSRYKMLLLVGDIIEEIRPQQVITFESPINNKFLKKISNNSPQKKVKAKKIKEKPSVKEPSIVVKEIKMENTDGSN
jgi:hypothetical protein